MRHRRLSHRWLDRGLAVVLLIAAEVELTSRLGVRPFLAAGLLALTVPLAWRRHAPLAVACLVMAALVVLRGTSAEFHSLSVPLFALFVLPYTVAAYEPRARALLGLVVCLAVPVMLHVIGPPSGSLVFLLGVPGAMWGVGRVIRRRRTEAEGLTVKADRIAAEREDRERLVLADERSRVARELQALVAKTVSAMVVQTEAAQRLLDTDAVRADEAMAAVEQTGRQALNEMRGILGMLGGEAETAELAPQPGVGQIATLIETARHDRRQVELQTHGEPYPLPASVNLGIYRILEEALLSTGVARDESMQVALRFGEHDVELIVTHAGATSPDWPTVAMRERVTLCEGELDVDLIDSTTERLVVRLPLEFEGVLA